MKFRLSVMAALYVCKKVRNEIRTHSNIPVFGNIPKDTRKNHFV